MGKINREELFKILDEQYEAVKSHIADHMDLYIERLYEYKKDVIDIKTEISMGNTLDDSLFKSADEDYYDKQKLLSSVPAKKEVSLLEDLSRLDEYKPGYRTVTAPKHKKKYLIKLNDRYEGSELEDIGKIITENQIFVYNNDVIEQIITLDVE